LLVNIIPQRGDNESDDDYRSRISTNRRLDTLIFELTTPLPEPEPKDEEEEEIIIVSTEDDAELQGEEGEVFQEPVGEGELSEEFSLDGLEIMDVEEFSFGELTVEKFNFDNQNGNLPAEQSDETLITEEAFSIVEEEKKEEVDVFANEEIVDLGVVSEVEIADIEERELERESGTENIQTGTEPMRPPEPEAEPKAEEKTKDEPAAE
jgi:hypothetical protein